MPFRIREILLVSSAYDAFSLEEDGPLTERLFSEYSDLQLSGAPRIIHVASIRDALQLLTERRIDLVVTVVRVEDGDATTLSRLIKAEHPELPVMLLAFDEADLQEFHFGIIPDYIDLAFLWTGHARSLIAAIKLAEDERNVAYDTAAASVQVIVVVEDGLRSYSAFLAHLYPELMVQAHSFIADGLNRLHRLLRMRARPKILLAKNYEEALTYCDAYSENICALITDLRFPKQGKENPDAGRELIHHLQQSGQEIPTLIQSAESDGAATAEHLGADFANKNSPGFHAQVHRFLTDRLGFGDFIFRTPDGDEIDRATNLYEMEQALMEIPDDALMHHAQNQDFSRWLKARTMFETAEKIRPRTSEEFGSPTEIRDFVVSALRVARETSQAGVIADLEAPPTQSENRFVRIGEGSIGGKGRSVAFVNAMIVRHGLLKCFSGLEIRIPKTVAIGTDEFDQFMAQPGADTSRAFAEDEDILHAFRELTMRPSLTNSLRTAFLALKGPLAVRSSSLLEDSRFRPFAGVYATYMLPNNHPDPEVRFEELLGAVKAVYASTFTQAAKNYVAGTPHTLEDEKMAVLIQQVVGEARADRFYPWLSGVAQSYNYYPVGHQEAEDGVAVFALGMGEMVVAGGRALRFSPGAPEVLPQYPTARSYLKGTQNEFFAIDTAEQLCDFTKPPTNNLRLHSLTLAERDGALALSGSVYCPEDDVIRDDLRRPGPRILTFNNLVKWRELPIVDALATLLPLLRDAMGGEVEVEFALGMAPERTKAELERMGPALARFYLLQLRPMITPRHQAVDIDISAVPPAEVLGRTERALGHGRMGDIHDVVYIRHSELSMKETKAAARQVGRINALLTASERPYLLVGPGRWGTSDPHLGIPIDWTSIAGARVIAELPMGDNRSEPSQGSHFFHNVTAHGIGYLTIYPEWNGSFDQAWLDALPSEDETDLVRHVTLDKPISILLDGRKGSAVILKPRASGVRDK